MSKSHCRTALCLVAVAGLQIAQAGPVADAIKERIEKRRAAAEQSDTAAGAEDLEGKAINRKISLPDGARVLSNISYGPDPAQRLDVYTGKNPTAAPIIMMVHGGAWMFGDKQNAGVVNSKIARWLPRNYLFVSINYRMSRSPNPLDQADDVGRALAFVQTHGSTWGGDPSRVLLMGHSAGAHLVALLAADRQIALRQGAKDWLGTIPLDSAALDVVSIMEGKHYRFYDRVFGAQRSHWIETSPTHRLSAAPRPMLLVCSAKRSDSCPAAQAFASKANALGGRASVLPVNLNHAAVVGDLGPESDYTTSVERFMQSLGLP